jgi:hypothetical protein
MTNEELQQAILSTQDCGMGDRDRDGNFRRIFCNDDSLSRMDGRNEDCACFKTFQAMLPLLAAQEAS